MATTEEIRAGALALRMLAGKLQTSLAPIVATAGGWALDADDANLPTQDAVKAQILAYQRLTLEPIRIADAIRAILAGDTTTPAESDLSVLADIGGMTGNVVTELGDPGSDENLVTEAAIRAAIANTTSGVSLCTVNYIGNGVADRIINLSAAITPACIIGLRELPGDLRVILLWDNGGLSESLTYVGEVGSGIACNRHVDAAKNLLPGVGTIQVARGGAEWWNYNEGQYFLIIWGVLV